MNYNAFDEIIITEIKFGVSVLKSKCRYSATSGTWIGGLVLVTGADTRGGGPGVRPPLKLSK